MKVEEYLEHGILLQLDITVNVLWHGHLGAVDHLLDLDPEQLGDVQLGEDEDRPEDQDVDRQDDHVDVDSCQRLPRPEREHFPDQSDQFLEIVNLGGETCRESKFLLSRAVLGHKAGTLQVLPTWQLSSLDKSDESEFDY